MRTTPALRTPAYSEKFDAALRLAAAAHYEDMRKGTAIPYVMHPFHVALILDRCGCHEDLVLAGVLHDVLEDTEFSRVSVRTRLRSVCPGIKASAAATASTFRRATVAYIRTAFGRRALGLVEHVTEQKTDAAGKARPWADRKAEQLAALAGASLDVCALKAADCLHNLHAMARDVRQRGTGALTRFKGGPEDTWDYYAGVVGIVAPRLGATHPLARELAAALDDFGRALGRP